MSDGGSEFYVEGRRRDVRMKSRIGKSEASILTRGAISRDGVHHINDDWSHVPAHAVERFGADVGDFAPFFRHGAGKSGMCAAWDVFHVLREALQRIALCHQGQECSCEFHVLGGEGVAVGWNAWSKCVLKFSAEGRPQNEEKRGDTNLLIPSEAQNLSGLVGHHRAAETRGSHSACSPD